MQVAGSGQIGFILKCRNTVTGPTSFSGLWQQVCGPVTHFYVSKPALSEAACVVARRKGLCDAPTRIN